MKVVCLLRLSLYLAPVPLLLVPDFAFRPLAQGVHPPPGAPGLSQQPLHGQPLPGCAHFFSGTPLCPPPVFWKRHCTLVVSSNPSGQCAVVTSLVFCSCLLAPHLLLPFSLATSLFPSFAPHPGCSFGLVGWFAWFALLMGGLALCVLWFGGGPWQM